MAEQHFSVGIIGAGIGGLALAIGLTHHNIPFTIYEAAPAFSTVGAGVGLGPNALRAMDLIDKRFRDKYTEIATGNSKAEKKHVMMEAMRMEEGLGKGERWWSHGEWGAPYFERTAAHRKDLLDIMTSFIDKESVRFNKSVRNIEQCDNNVTLIFADGGAASHAMVVDCGGIKGLARRIVLAGRYPESVEPQYTHKYVYRKIISVEESKQILGDLATDAKMYMSKNSNLSTYPISQGKQLNVVAFKRDPDAWQHVVNTHEVDQKTMLNDFADIAVDTRLLRLIESAAPTRWAIFHHPHTPTYYNSLICLLGDVAHASSPHQGAGAGQCLEDALILTHALGRLHAETQPSTLGLASPLRTKSIEAALQAYDEIRRPRAQEQVRTAHECGELYNLRDPVTGEDLDMELVLANLNSRFEWLWLHDLEADVRRVEERTVELLASLES